VLPEKNGKTPGKDPSISQALSAYCKTEEKDVR
jgi:hypothetical protein